MPPSAFAVGLGLCLLAGCASDRDARPNPPKEIENRENGAVPDQPMQYSGPELTASVETRESHPPQYTLLVEINCPTGGYTVTTQGVAEHDGVRRARLILTAPAQDEMVTQAFELLTARMDLGTARTPVRVLVTQHRRKEPVTGKYALAGTVNPR